MSGQACSKCGEIMGQWNWMTMEGVVCSEACADKCEKFTFSAATVSASARLWASVVEPDVPAVTVVSTAGAWVSSKWTFDSLGGGFDRVSPKPLTPEDKAVHRAIGFGFREENRMGAAQFLAGDDD